MTALDTRPFPYGDSDLDSVQHATPPSGVSERRWMGVVGALLVLTSVALMALWFVDRDRFDFLPFQKDEKPTVVLGVQTDPLLAAWPYLHPPKYDAMVTSCTNDPRNLRGVVTLRVINFSLTTARYQIKLRVVSGKDGSTIQQGRASVAPLLPNETGRTLSTIWRRMPAGSTCVIDDVQRIPVA